MRWSRLRTTGKAVNGKVVTRAKFPEGTKLVLHVEESGPIVELDAEDERAIDQALVSIRAGKGISLDKFARSCGVSDIVAS